MKLIVSGTGHLNSQGVYIPTVQDKNESMELIEDFTEGGYNALCRTFAQVKVASSYIEAIAEYEDNPRYDELLQIAQSRLQVRVPDWGNSPNFRRNTEFAYLDLATRINPLGYEDEDTLIKRSFSAYFWMRGQFRPKFGKRWMDTHILSYYYFSDDMNDCLTQLRQYLDRGYRYFINYRVKHNFKHFSHF